MERKKNMEKLINLTRMIKLGFIELTPLLDSKNVSEFKEHLHGLADFEDSKESNKYIKDLFKCMSEMGKRNRIGEVIFEKIKQFEHPDLGESEDLLESIIEEG